MPRTDERIASDLLDSYIEARRKGRDIDVDRLISECPESERENLRLALYGTDFLFEHGSSLFVSERVVDRVRAELDDLARLRESAETVRREYETKMPGRPVAATDIVARLSEILGIHTRIPFAASMATQPAVMYRAAGKPRAESAAVTKAQRILLEKQAAEKAKRLALTIGLTDPPVDVAAVAKDLGILLLEENLTDCDGCLVIHDGAAAVVVNRDLQPIGRKRFTVAHEIGHFQLHRQTGYWAESARDMETGWHSGAEFEANVFAAELLMPSRYVDANFAQRMPTLWTVDELATCCNVSTTAAAVRLARLSHHACAVVYVSEGRIRWFAASEYFPYWIPVGQQVNPVSGAGVLLDGGSFPDRPESLPASAWVPDDTKTEEADIQEHSRLLYPDAVLSLLYVDE